MLQTMKDTADSNHPQQLGSLPILTFATQQEWEAWLEGHHADAAGLWLKIAKKGAKVPTLTYAAAVESGLCFGWIDSQKASLDDQCSLQRFTPRRAKSIWSRVNREKAEALIAAGRMRPAGLQQVEAAKDDGRWDAAYDSPSAMTIPEDFQRELDAHPDACAFFNTLDRANRYAILYRLQEARRPETRARRLDKFVGMLREGRRIHE